MRPRVIVHNSISIDGCFDGFPVNLETHYGRAMAFDPDALMAGSMTVSTALEDIPPETEEDLKNHTIEDNDPRPYWVVVDSKGLCKGILHFFRKMEYIKEIIVLVTEQTPADYLEYLNERGYPIIQTGTTTTTETAATGGGTGEDATVRDDSKKHVDLKEALKALRDQFDIETLVVDSGGRLVGALLEEGIVDELSLVIFPILVGSEMTQLFDSHLGTKDAPMKLRLVECESLKNGAVHVQYEIS